ncbi:hypothetical protein F542_13050 [Bibersteinia trehalosi USDA-ARS-USMARC-188]|uniref:Uncharacterized protein n=4 Tax=Bibersteinia trehalosi TaxID=47735 RepID=W0R5W6_BIBTR|nr:hypothetical protein WQG_8990 [Bibersteinia trehalosi USDA-ARS-USMARC-192]AHG82023.1 hypothetical protein F542_13050 [Bibersteinia trehalosi USDA-ARS-USMARC-188]AHG84330.1 hypothetical protein F543_14660 [Bibersteinia trehalosi USDA-ARS-USMARC-189]AHG86161.1 hypothetical protein F544_9320 [Bibersteinia trehalosi USDA-ARS-USMARC-190]OAQ15802.1 hypothetical protein F480_01825 [Bibersteinia trehalosi Y31]
MASGENLQIFCKIQPLVNGLEYNVYQYECKTLFLGQK